MTDVQQSAGSAEGTRRAAARRVGPTAAAAGRAVVVDSWPLVRAGVGQLLVALGLEVVAEGPSAADAIAAARSGGALDLAVIGVGAEPQLEAVRRLRSGEGVVRAVVVLVDRVDGGELRQLLALGVGGVVPRSSTMDELADACRQVRAGRRVVSGPALAVLAAGGLDLVPDPGTAAAADEQLTPKEREVLAHLARHRSNAEIARLMVVSAATVKTHLSNIYAKLGVAGRREAVVAAAERGLLA